MNRVVLLFSSLIAIAACYHKHAKDQDRQYYDLYETLKNPNKVFRVSLSAQNLIDTLPSALFHDLPAKLLKGSDLLGTWKYTKGSHSIAMNFKADGTAFLTLDEEKNKPHTFVLDTSENQNLLKIRGKDKDSNVVMLYKINNLTRDTLWLIFFQVNSLNIDTKKWKESLFQRPVQFTLIRANN